MTQRARTQLAQGFANLSSHRRWATPRRMHRTCRQSGQVVTFFSGPPNSPSGAEIAPMLDEFARRPPRPMTLSSLLSYGRPLTPDSVLQSVSYVLSEVPRLFGLRVRNLEALPFIVGMNPYIAKILAAHRRAFQVLATHPPVLTLEENAKFTQTLEALVQAHANDIPTMAKGFQECSRYMTPDQISDFLDSAIRNRIAVRLIAEQHIALSRTLEHPEQNSPDHIGIVHTKCSPKEMIRMCGSFVRDLCEATLGASPEIVIDGAVDATFAYVPVHLEYILTEILKNAFRATVERYSRNRQPGSSIPPVVITIAPPQHHPQTMGAFPRPPSFLSLRIRDQGGGVPEANLSQIFSYSFTTAGRQASDPFGFHDDTGGGPYAAQHVGGSAAMDDGGSMSGTGLFGEIVGRGVQVGMGTIAGLGYGLPMSRLYARYFGGSLDFMSLEGWGSDVFVKLRSLGDAEDIHIG